MNKTNRKYYVELVVNGEDAPYALQTEWVDTVQEAKDLISKIDYIDSDQLALRIMCADWDSDENCYDDIEVYADISIKNNQVSLSKINNDDNENTDSGDMPIKIDYEQLANGLITDMCETRGVRETIDLLANYYGFGITELKHMDFDPDDIQVVVGHKIELGYNMLGYIITVAECGGNTDELYTHILPNLGFTKAACDDIRLDVLHNDQIILQTFYKMIGQISEMIPSENEYVHVLQRLGFSPDDFEDYVW